MNKKHAANYTILAGIATSVILVASLIIASNPLSQQALAQPANTTSTTAPKPKATQPLNKPFVVQGTISSTTDALPGQKGQVAVILSPRAENNAVYTGVLTFTATKAVDVQVYQAYTVNNDTQSKIPKGFGTVTTTTLPNGKKVTISTVASGDSASIPFTASSLALHSKGNSPFVATYTVSASATTATTSDNLASAEAASTTSSSGSSSSGSSSSGSSSHGSSSSSTNSTKG